MRFEARESPARRIIDLGKLARYKNHAIWLHEHGVYDAVCASLCYAIHPGGIQRAIGIQAGDVPSCNAANAAESTADQQITIGQRHNDGHHRGVRSGHNDDLRLKRCIAGAITIEPDDVVDGRAGTDRVKRSADEDFPIWKQGQRGNTIVEDHIFRKRIVQ